MTPNEHRIKRKSTSSVSFAWTKLFGKLIPRARLWKKKSKFSIDPRKLSSNRFRILEAQVYSPTLRYPLSRIRREPWVQSRLKPMISRAKWASSVQQLAAPSQRTRRGPKSSCAHPVATGTTPPAWRSGWRSGLNAHSAGRLSLSSMIESNWDKGVARVQTSLACLAVSTSPWKQCKRNVG
jgi:hypothetical protein